VSATASPVSDQADTRPVGPARFRRRLTLAFVLVGAATGAVLALSAYLTIREYRHRSFVKVARREAELSLLPAPSRFSPKSLDALLQEYRDRAGIETVVMTGTGAVASSPDLSAEMLPARFVGQVAGGTIQQTELAISRRPYLVLGGVPAPGIKLFFFFPLADLHRSVREFALVLLLGWVIAVLCSAAVGDLVARRTLRPVRAAGQAAQALAEGLLETRLDLTSNDEFGQWAGSFNRMADALSAKIQALSEARERERRFTSDVAHELRTPLSAMVSTAEILWEDLERLPADTRPSATLLVKDVSRLSELVQELLELARLDAGQEEVHLEPLSVAEALGAVVRAGPSASTIRLDVEPGLAIWADRPRFRRVVSNLVSNAVGHGGGDVTLSAHRAGDVVAIDVRDRGPGIPAASLGKIFDRFYKQDTARSAGGSGLGLAIALEHARAQGGSLRAASPEGGGACFTFCLPIVGDQPDGGGADTRCDDGHPGFSTATFDR
jgi:signal transduction histidine kinase